jgi:prepilin-type N-terminal cleavage/methylation domain-containing protein
MRQRRGFTLSEVLVSVSLIAVLLGILVPALVHSREAARRTICSNRIRQGAFALLHLTDTGKRLPSKEPTAWSIQVVEHLDPTFFSTQVSALSNASDHEPLSLNRVNGLLCPTGKKTLIDGRNISNFAMNESILGLKLAHISDGTTATILLAEIPSELASLWTWGPLANTDNTGSSHPGMCHIAAIDGSIHRVSQSTDRTVMASWFDPVDGKTNPIE